MGDSFPSSDQTVFYVTTDDPPAGVESGGLMKSPEERHYWRGAIFDGGTKHIEFLRHDDGRLVADLNLRRELVRQDKEKTA